MDPTIIEYLRRPPENFASVEIRDRGYFGDVTLEGAMKKLLSELNRGTTTHVKDWLKGDYKLIAIIVGIVKTGWMFHLRENEYNNNASKKRELYAKEQLDEWGHLLQRLMQNEAAHGFSDSRTIKSLKSCLKSFLDYLEKYDKEMRGEGAQERLSKAARNFNAQMSAWAWGSPQKEKSAKWGKNKFREQLLEEEQRQLQQEEMEARAAESEEEEAMRDENARLARKAQWNALPADERAAWKAAHTEEKRAWEARLAGAAHGGARKKTRYNRTKRGKGTRRR